MAWFWPTMTNMQLLMTASTIAVWNRLPITKSLRSPL